MNEQTEKEVSQQPADTQEKQDETGAAAVDRDEKKEEETPQQELDACKSELQEYKDRCMRLSADFANYKQRLEKERASLKRMLQTDILRDLLTLVDNFDRALQQTQTENAETNAWLEGFDLIRKDLYKLLHKYGVKEIEATDVFDPELHEAVMQVQSQEHESGKIVEVLQKGYLLDDTVLRPAKVSVAQ